MQNHSLQQQISQDIKQLKQIASVKKCLYNLYVQLFIHEDMENYNQILQKSIEELYYMQVEFPAEMQARSRSLILNMNLLRSKQDCVLQLLPALEENHIQAYKPQKNLENLQKKIDSSPYNVKQAQQPALKKQHVENMSVLQPAGSQETPVTQYQFSVLNKRSQQPRQQKSMDYTAHFQHYLQQNRDRLYDMQLQNNISRNKQRAAVDNSSNSADDIATVPAAIEIPVGPTHAEQIKNYDHNELHELDEYEKQQEDEQYKQFKKQQASRRQAMNPAVMHNINQLLVQKKKVPLAETYQSPGQERVEQSDLVDGFTSQDVDQIIQQNKNYNEEFYDTDGTQPLGYVTQAGNSSVIESQHGNSLLASESLPQGQRLRQYGRQIFTYMWEELKYDKKQVLELLQQVYVKTRSYLKTNSAQISFEEENGLINQVMDTQLALGDVDSIQMKQLVYVIVEMLKCGLDFNYVFPHSLVNAG